MFINLPFGSYRSKRQAVNENSALASLVMVPGLLLTAMAIAILLWPELLAYMVAGAMLLGGLSLLMWGWRMRRVATSRQYQSTVVHYDVF